jgi:hypothetical protein
MSYCHLHPYKFEMLKVEVRKVLLKTNINEFIFMIRGSMWIKEVN